MVICSCNVICDARIREAIGVLRADDPKARITVGRIYATIGLRPDCRNCLPYFNQRVREILKAMDAGVPSALDTLGLDDLPRRPNRLAAPTQQAQ